MRVLVQDALGAPGAAAEVCAARLPRQPDYQPTMGWRLGNPPAQWCWATRPPAHWLMGNIAQHALQGPTAGRCIPTRFCPGAAAASGRDLHRRDAARPQRGPCRGQGMGGCASGRECGPLTASPRCGLPYEWVFLTGPDHLLRANLQPQSISASTVALPPVQVALQAQVVERLAKTYPRVGLLRFYDLTVDLHNLHEVRHLCAQMFSTELSERCCFIVCNGAGRKRMAATLRGYMIAVTAPTSAIHRRRDIVCASSFPRSSTQ